MNPHHTTPHHTAIACTKLSTTYGRSCPAPILHARGVFLFALSYVSGREEAGGVCSRILHHTTVIDIHGSSMHAGTLQACSSSSCCMLLKKEEERIGLQTKRVGKWVQEKQKRPFFFPYCIYVAKLAICPILSIRASTCTFL